MQDQAQHQPDASARGEGSQIWLGPSSPPAWCVAEFTLRDVGELA
jgi:hypothetical protein